MGASKICSVCKREFPLYMFYKRDKRGTTRRKECVKCHKKGAMPSKDRERLLKLALRRVIAQYKRHHSAVSEQVRDKPVAVYVSKKRIRNAAIR